MRHFVFLSVFLLSALIISSASAHVVLTEKEAPSGGRYKAALTVTHGCGESATTKVTVKIPEGMIAVKPMPKPGWEIETVKGAYEKTYNFLHGRTLSEGVTSITWSGGRLENEFFDEFVFAGFIGDSVAEGTTLYFPVEQVCTEGSHSWSEIPVSGQDAHSLKSPAAALRITAPKAKASAPALWPAQKGTVDTPDSAAHKHH